MTESVMLSTLTLVHLGNRTKSAGKPNYATDYHRHEGDEHGRGCKIRHASTSANRRASYRLTASLGGYGHDWLDHGSYKLLEFFRTLPDWPAVSASPATAG
jgi:hypothetical protein